MDSLICCKMFPDWRDMDENSLAYLLGISYKGCVGMAAKDVAELYAFFLASPTLHSNPIRYWQNVLERKMGNPDDRAPGELGYFNTQKSSGRTVKRACLAYDVAHTVLHHHWATEIISET